MRIFALLLLIKVGDRSVESALCGEHCTTNKMSSRRERSGRIHGY